MVVRGPVVKLSNGAEMPLVGLGTWLVLFLVLYSDQVYLLNQFIKCKSTQIKGKSDSKHK